jgi:succinate-semialdehyde dehydrogenase/glutarate-semialdehyde dehydrogenase
MSIMQEEVFGPVVTVQSFTDMEATIRQANATPYGLAAYLFTSDLGNALEWARQLECGSVWINRIHQAYPEAPFGGIKESGLGREKSHFGIEEYTELKTIYLSY